MKSAVALVLLLLFSAYSRAADPPKIGRPTLKEPAYQTQPKYFVLLFGPRGDTQIWCVHDGDALYVDKNGSGDLTEAGKRIQIQDGVKEENGYTGYPGGVFDAGEIQSKDGKSTYRRLHIGRYK